MLHYIAYHLFPYFARSNHHILGHATPHLQQSFAAFKFALYHLCLGQDFEIFLGLDKGVHGDHIHREATTGNGKVLFICKRRFFNTSSVVSCTTSRGRSNRRFLLSYVITDMLPSIPLNMIPALDSSRADERSILIGSACCEDLRRLMACLLLSFNGFTTQTYRQSSRCLKWRNSAVSNFWC